MPQITNYTDHSPVKCADLAARQASYDERMAKLKDRAEVDLVFNTEKGRLAAQWNGRGYEQLMIDIAKDNCSKGGTGADSTDVDNALRLVFPDAMKGKPTRSQVR